MTVPYDGPDSMCTRGWFLRIAQQARGRLNQDSPWRHCLKLSDKHPARACALVGNLKPPTHMCIKFCPGSTEHRCYILLSLTHRNISKNDHYNPTHPYSSVGVGRHNTSPKWHAEVTEGMAAAATTRAGGVASLSGMEVTDDFIAGLEEAARLATDAGDTARAEGIKKFVKPMASSIHRLRAKQKGRLAQVYVYSSSSISQRTFECPYFRAALREGDKAYPVFAKCDLEAWVTEEYNLFQIYLIFALKETLKLHKGNPFAQLIHDGTHLEDHNHYQAIGLSFVFEWLNWTLAIALPECHDGTAAGVASLILKIFEPLGFEFQQVVRTLIQDFAALAVANELHLAKHGCLMHCGDKVPREALGLLDRTRDGQAIDPFPEGKAVYTAIRELAKHFSWGGRLKELEPMCKAMGCAFVKPALDLNKTRIAAVRKLYESMMRGTPGYGLYGHQNPQCGPAQAVTHRIWCAAREQHVVLNTVGKLTTLVQTERTYAGSYRPVLLDITGRHLDPVDHQMVQVYDVFHMDASPNPPRIDVAFEDFTDAGKETMRRAKRAADRRFKLEGAVPKDDDLAACALDLRLCNRLGEFLSDDSIAQAKRALKEAYIKYAVKAREYDFDQEKEALLAAAQAKAKADHARKTRKVVVHGVVFKARVEDAPMEEESDTEESDEEVAVHFDEWTAREEAEEEYDRAYRLWVRKGADIDWRATFPKELAGVPEDATLDLVDDLYKLDMGVIYNALYESDQGYERQIYGHLPLMAICTTSDNLASSFSENLISVANLVMPEGRTMLSACMVEKLSILRMNRKFMEYMRKKHPELAAGILKKQLEALVRMEMEKEANANPTTPSTAAAPRTPSAPAPTATRPASASEATSSPASPLAAASQPSQSSN